VDAVKEQLVHFFCETIEAEDALYLYHPEIVESVEGPGLAVSTIGNYETDGWLLDLHTALKQTFYVVATEDPDYEKVILLITDRLQDDAALQKLLFLEDRQQTECTLILVGIGSHYKKKLLADLAKADSVLYLHLDNPSSLSSNLMNCRS